ncbi:MAG: inorganic phosphate transporter [Candidatus Marsarchaeota archaeon]|nr:inorganic phosphate transporter [Candidatus Marsarchaeota archaeon]
MLTEIIDLVLAFVLVALVSGNNLSACSGPAITGRVVSKRNGVVLTIIGYAAGFLLQGSILRFGVSRLMPSGSLLAPIIFIISIAVFIIAHRKRVPESLSVTFISALIGVGLAYGTLDTGFVAEILLFWIIAGILSLVMASVALRAVQKALYRDKVWNGVRTVRILLLVLSFFTAFTLGANTIGVVASVLQPTWYAYVVILLAIVLGSFLLSSGELRRIGNEIIPIRYANALVSQLVAAAFVEFATLLSIPLSNTQMLTSTIYGTGLGYKEKLLSKKPAVQIASIWIFTAVFSVSVAYAAARIIVLL